MFEANRSKNHACFNQIQNYKGKIQKQKKNCGKIRPTIFTLSFNFLIFQNVTSLQIIPILS